MADGKLKNKAKTKAKSNGKLAGKAKSRAPNMKAQTVDEIQREQGTPPSPVIADPQPFNQAPPLPPALTYLRKVATIPALRKMGAME